MLANIKVRKLFDFILVVTPCFTQKTNACTVYCVLCTVCMFLPVAKPAAKAAVQTLKQL